ncbi:MAG: HEPN domain-containing protein [Chloroflexi bacterium]|nr:HEPN domain-containing protein [Chloroflexota bacterium]
MKDDASKQALVNYRMDRALQTLHAAQALHSQNEDPASVVNRAYYAMFYAALAMLATIGHETEKLFFLRGD